jgi:hypothetical protein
MKKISILMFCLLVPAVVSAQNVGRCGWGSKLFDGQKGIAPQVLAVTTNGTSGNQTFAISSGTSGCTQDGVVNTNWKTAAFIDSNMTKLARDMSRGEGEALDSLATLLDVSAADKVAFNQTMQANFDTVFASEDVTTDAVRQNLVSVLNATENLSQYSARV